MKSSVFVDYLFVGVMTIFIGLVVYLPLILIIKFAANLFFTIIWNPDAPWKVTLWSLSLFLSSWFVSSRKFTGHGAFICALAASLISVIFVVGLISYRNNPNAVWDDSEHSVFLLGMVYCPIIAALYGGSIGDKKGRSVGA
jgi:hypothetical protein